MIFVNPVVGTKIVLLNKHSFVCYTFCGVKIAKKSGIINFKSYLNRLCVCTQGFRETMKGLKYGRFLWTFVLNFITNSLSLKIVYVELQPSRIAKAFENNPQLFPTDQNYKNFCSNIIWLGNLLEINVKSYGRSWSKNQVLFPSRSATKQVPFCAGQFYKFLKLHNALFPLLLAV